MPRRGEYAAIPRVMRETLDAWASSARPVGRCTQAILEGDLFETLARADSETTAALPLIVRYIFNRLPSGCWGSPQKVREWPHLCKELQRGHSTCG